MPDIGLRFGRDMLVLSAPLDVTLARQGIDAPRDRQYLNLMEPDAIIDAFRLEAMAGAQCLVTTTEDITRARLAHVRMEGDAVRLAHSAVDIAAGLKPQHILVEIGPCGLPLDASSKASLNENRAEYAGAARAFDGCEFDAFFLNGFFSLADLKCALMGVAQVSDKPVFASVVIGEDCDAASQAPSGASPASTTQPAPLALSEEATLFELDYQPIDGPIAPAVPQLKGCLDASQWADAIDVMMDMGASVVGFETAEPLGKALSYAQLAVQRSGLPVLAQLRVSAGDAAESKVAQRARALVPIEERVDYAPDTMEHAAVKLYGAGVQFLRATGAATPAYTGALAATVSGLDVFVR